MELFENNTLTNPGATIVFDSFGQDYCFEFFCDDEDELKLYLIRRNRNVGHIFCIFNNGEMDIADIFIRDDVVHGQRGCFFSLLKLFHWKPKTTNYRNRGLGRLLIKYVIQRAKERGIKRITGVVMPHDREELPRLIQWYQKRGFQIHKRYYPERETPTYFIRMDLEQE